MEWLHGQHTRFGKGRGVYFGSLCVRGFWEAEAHVGSSPCPCLQPLLSWECQPRTAADVAPGRRAPGRRAPGVTPARARPTPGMPHPHTLPQGLWLSPLNKLGSSPRLPFPGSVRRWPGGDRGESIQGCCWRRFPEYCEDSPLPLGLLLSREPASARSWAGPRTVQAWGLGQPSSLLPWEWA